MCGSVFDTFYNSSIAIIVSVGIFNKIKYDYTQVRHSVPLCRR